jgi:acetyltransferase-like isoleucine patch superfamily enzyme
MPSSDNLRDMLRARMPRTINRWPSAFTLGNILGILRARRQGATVSLNQVKLEVSTVEPNALVMEYALIRHSHISRYSIIGPYSSLFKVEVGPYSGVAERVTVGALPHWPELPTSHVFPLNAEFGLCGERPWPEVPGTTLGADSWVGAAAVVRAGVRIGHGAVVAAGAVVTKDVADYEIVAGVPAKRVRMRFADDIVERLVKLQWWQWPPAYIRDTIELFQVPLTPDSLSQLEERGAVLQALSIEDSAEPVGVSR